MKSSFYLFLILFSTLASQDPSQQRLGTSLSFYELNNVSEKDIESLSQEDRLNFSICKQLYEKSLSFEKAKTASRIPHIIHFIWLGPKEFPTTSIKNVRSWKQKHPDWIFYFWTDNAQRPCPIDGMEKRLVSEIDLSKLKPYYENSDNWGQKSDILRYVILDKHGGIYVDHDILCYECFDDHADRLNLFCGLQPIIKNEIHNAAVIPCNCLIGASPNHIVLKQTIENVISLSEKHLKINLEESTYEKVISTTFSAFYTAALQHSGLNQNHDVIFPASFFFPFSTVKDLKKLNTLKEKKYIHCNHSFQGTWL